MITVSSDVHFNYLYSSEKNPSGLPVAIIRPKNTELVNSWEGQYIRMEIDIKREMKYAHNVIGYLDNKAEYTIVIGGHYDHVGIGNFGSRAGKGSGIHNGADDNASGTAMVMELARYIKSSSLKNYNYMFIAFGAEEKGLYGSKAFCNSHIIGLNKIDYFINFDMVGRMRRLRDKAIVLGLGTSDVWKPLIRKTKYKRGRLAKFKSAWDASDHADFKKNHVPFIYFTTGLHSDYHTPSDDTKYINFDGMVKIFNYVTLIINEMDEKPKLVYKEPGKDAIIKYIGMFIP